MDAHQAKFEYLLRQGDNALILGHRVSEWCGHAPALEEDIALANQALDLIGQCQLWLGLAGEVEGRGRDADALAYLRDAGAFRNLLLVEQRVAQDTLARQRARIRPIASPEGASCVERLLDPYPALLERQLTRMHDSRAH